MKKQDEKQSEKLFKNYKKQLIKKLGKKGLFGETINDVGSELFGKSWRGYFLQNENGISNKPGYYIINTDIIKKNGKGGEGIHWTAIYSTPKTIYVYDSFARDPEKILKHLTKKFKDKKINIISSDRSDAEQFSDSEICGQLSLAFLCVVKDLGIRRAILI